MNKNILNNYLLAGLLLPIFSTHATAEETVLQVPEVLVLSPSKVAQPKRVISTSVTLIESDEIEEAGYTSLPELLRTVGSVGVSNNGGPGKATSLRIRGEEGFRTTFRIDGIDVSDPTGTQVQSQVQHFMLNGDIDRIEVLRGPQGFVYGADAGGVVNITTPTGNGPISGSVNQKFGSFNTRVLSGNIHGSHQGIDYFFSISEQDTAGINARASDVSGELDGYENRTYHAKIGFAISEALNLKFVARDIDATNEFDSCFSSILTDDCVGKYKQSIYNTSLEYAAEDVSHQVSYTMSDIKRNNFADGAFSYGSIGERKRFEYLGNIETSFARITFGADDETEEARNFAGNNERDLTGLFIELGKHLTDELILTAGVRRDRNSKFGSFMSERISAAYLQSIRDKHFLKYRLSYGTGFRAPSLFEEFYNNSGIVSNLTEETSEGYDIGVDYSYKNRFFMELTYFNQKIEDQIDYDFTFDRYVQSPGTSRSEGAELALDTPLDENFDLYANYTYNDAKDPDEQQRVRRPRHLGNVGFKYRGLADKLAANLNFRFSADSVDLGGVPLDSYGLVDLNIDYQLNDQASVYSNINNLFDRDYVEVIGFNTLDRAILVGVRLEF